MIKIKIISIGKIKEAWLDEALSLYFDRLEGKVSFEMEWVKEDAMLEKAAAREKTVIALDPKGEAMASEAFSDYLQKALESGGSRIAFIIGGPNGLPLNLKKKLPLISLSKMTLTHQMARLILVEQIYRAFEIGKGSGYHK